MKSKIIIAILLGLNISLLLSQTNETTNYKYFSPRDTSNTIWEIGAGTGIPYGTFGGKYAIGNKFITGGIGIGFLPFAWTPAFSFSGALHFRDRYADIRPKITLSYSNVAAAILILSEGSLDPLHDETFSGFGLFAGIDWRLSKTSPFCLDLNIGWVFPSVGTDKIKSKYDEITSELELDGYIFEKEAISLDTPKLFIGITYSPGRSLK